jgi:ParB/RepB/Spo0J family partition protein
LHKHGVGGEIQDEIGGNGSIGYFIRHMETIESSSIDLRLERTRLRNNATEQALLDSIAREGILDPLYVAGRKETQQYLLLDGFKRYRCARKLGMGMVPAECVAEDVATGIVTFIRRNEYGSGITILEQASLIEELHRRCAMSIYDIAQRLDRSPAWVSVRLGILDDLTPLVRDKIISGAFPARAYLYGIKGFTRVNNIGKDRVDSFVGAVSGKQLSTRDLFVLSRAFFTGGNVIERLVLEGDAHRALRMLTIDTDGSDDTSLSEKERLFINDLQTHATGMSRIIAQSGILTMDTGPFSQYVNLWSAAILKRLSRYTVAIKELYDRTGHSECGARPVTPGSKPQGDSATAAH